VWLSSGETLNVRTPDGRGGSGGGGISVGVLNVSLPGVTNAQQFSQQLKIALQQEARALRNSGAAISAGR